MTDFDDSVLSSNTGPKGFWALLREDTEANVSQIDLNTQDMNEALADDD